MSYQVDASLDSLVNVLSNNMGQVIKDRIKSKLMILATEVVEQVATEMAKDLMVDISGMMLPPMGSAEGIQLRLIVGPDRKEKNFVVEKIVKEV